MTSSTPLEFTGCIAPRLFKFLSLHQPINWHLEEHLTANRESSSTCGGLEQVDLRGATPGKAINNLSISLVPSRKLLLGTVGLCAEVTISNGGVTGSVNV